MAVMLAVVLSGCTIRLSSSNTAGPIVAIDPAPVDDAPEISYEDLSLEEKMEYKSVINLVRATDYSSELLAPALDKQTDLWGYINLQGEWIVAPTYKTAGAFCGEYAVVQDKYGDYIIIDRTGGIVAETYGMYPICYVGRATEDGVFNIAASVPSDQKYTFMNASGEEAINPWNIPATYYGLYSSMQYYELATPFREGKAVVMRATNASLKSKALGDYYSEIAYIIDTNGTCIGSFPQGLDVDLAGFDENMLIIVTDGGDLYGLADEEGKIVVPAEYDSIAHCEGSVYLVEKDGLFGFINRQGETVVECKYKNAMPFSEGRAAVYNGEAWGFIDRDGDVVIDFQFDDVAAINVSEYGDGTASGAFSSGIAMVRSGRFWGLINTNGEIILAAEAEDCPVKAVRNGYLSFEYNDSCGVFTTDGRYVLLPSYGNVGEFR